MADSYAIKTDRLSRAFKSTIAVDGVSLAIPRGIVFGFLGPNGAGKTTTIRLLLGLIEPTGGRAEVLGNSLPGQSQRIREMTGALLEQTGLYERLSAEDNLTFYGRAYRMSPKERDDRIRELLTRFGLYERRKERVGSWSRGMKQKLAVARAMFHRPDILFLDEPTAGLDPVAAAGLRDILATLVEDEGLTVFLTTHNLMEAEKLCALVGVINKGRIVTVGAPAELRSGGDTVKVLVRGTGITESEIVQIGSMNGVTSCKKTADGMAIVGKSGMLMAPVIRFLVESGAAIEEVTQEKASLEETFLKLIEEEQR